MADTTLFLASFLILLVIISAFNPQESIIKQVNNDPNAGWEAAMNARLSNYTVGQLKHLFGVKPTLRKDLMSVPLITHPKSFKLPRGFDARTARPQCSTIGRILAFLCVKCWPNFTTGDQGHCGSCWAFGAVESLSDRFCIHFGMNISLSVNDLVACCGFMCGGCDGGNSIYAWQYLVHHGVVTEECDPYFDDTACSHPGCKPAYPTPKCVEKCVNENQLRKESKHYAVSAYRISSDPYSVLLTILQDFANYKSGVYKHVAGDLLANQWNRGWGNKRINECGIEDNVVVGLPSTKNLVREIAIVDAVADMSV
ncbi:hypothetical protein ACJW31_08G065800 [Castanea mollissima]